MLQENHRMTANLAWFTENVLGYDGYRACSDCNCRCHRAHPECIVPLLEMSRAGGHGRPLQGTPLVAEALRPEHTFVLIELEARPERADAIEDEAALVADLVLGYLEGRGNGDEDSVFVVTPHHTQRIAVLGRLAQRGVRTDQVCVDTVEKMQGQERDLVVVCYGGLVDLDEPGELDFAYSRERLNTAITRAKKKCVLVCSLEVLEPTLAACETAERQTGFELLRRISVHCPQVADHGCVRLRQGATAPPAAPEDSQETIMSQTQGGPARRASQLSLAVASQQDDSDETDDDERGGGVAGSPLRRLASSLMPPLPAIGTHLPLATRTEGAGGGDLARIVDSQETQVDSMELSLVYDNAIQNVDGRDAQMTQLVGQAVHEDVPGLHMTSPDEAVPATHSTAGTPRRGDGQNPATPPQRGNHPDSYHSGVPPLPPRMHAAAASSSRQPLTARPTFETESTPKRKRDLPPSLKPGGRGRNAQGNSAEKSRQ